MHLEQKEQRNQMKEQQDKNKELKLKLELKEVSNYNKPDYNNKNRENRCYSSKLGLKRHNLRQLYVNKKKLVNFNRSLKMKERLY